MSIRAIAHRLGVSEKAIRKPVGLSSGRERELALAGITTAVGRPPATRVPSATSTGEDVDGAMSSAEDRAGDRDPIAWPAVDGEPVPMSLDRDASDRTFDRAARLSGLLDDAAPLFREACSVPGVGVLLALPAFAREWAAPDQPRALGEIGPAFDGLRTTLLTLLFMAPLRIKRPEHLKERDPAALQPPRARPSAVSEDAAAAAHLPRGALLRRAAGPEPALLRRSARTSHGVLYVDGHVRADHGERAIASGLRGAPRSGHARQHRLLDRRPLRRSGAGDYLGARRCFDAAFPRARAKCGTWSASDGSPSCSTARTVGSARRSWTASIC